MLKFVFTVRSKDRFNGRIYDETFTVRASHILSARYTAEAMVPAGTLIVCRLISASHA